MHHRAGRRHDRSDVRCPVGSGSRRNHDPQQACCLPDRRHPLTLATARPPTIDIVAAPRILFRLTALALRYPGRCFLAVIAALGAAILNLVTPRLLGGAVDQARLLHPGSVASAADSGLLTMAGLIIAASAARGLFAGLQGYQGEVIANRVGYDLRLAFFDQLQRLSFGYHDQIHSGDLISRGILDVEGVRGFLETGLLRAVSLLLLVGVGSWHLIGTDAATGLLALSFVPFVVWEASRMGALLRISWVRLQELMSELSRVMEENLQGAKVVRAFSARVFEFAKFDRISDPALRLSNERITSRMNSVTRMNLVYYIAMGLVLLVGAHRVNAGKLTVGYLTEILTFMTILQQPLRQIAMIVSAGARATSAGGRLFEILDLVPEIADKPGTPELAITQGVLRFEQVWFGYKGSPTGKATLTDISFEVRPGQTLAIVGPPGSGKSTIAHLIPRFYEADHGRITIDGQDIRSVTLDSLRRAVGLVQQDVFLFDTSVANNVAYTDPGIDEYQIIGATAAAQLHEHIDRLPARYRTRVGERGVALSGGQRQRTSIARGIVAEPSILVLDDATAAIDATTERRIHDALKHVNRSMATILIAHRLGPLKDADEIIVLDEGRIVERGRHDELVALGGHYADLWRLQTGGEAEAARRVSA
jgi:ATP-binding cassette, subfamily B, multidrug efflux pump